MNQDIAVHYTGHGKLADAIAERLREAGKDPARLTTSDLASVDEFHIRGRKATLELAAKMNLGPGSHVLDIGSGLGGPARTLVETYGCHVTGIDLTPAFCEAATTMSGWVGLGDRVIFKEGDATAIPFPDGRFDAALTIHVAMNVPAKDEMYRHARRVVKPGSIFAVYDVLQGEGGTVRYPVPWARDASISHLVTIDEMKELLTGAGFRIVEVHDSTAESLAWFETMTARMASAGPPLLTFQTFLGADFVVMARNQVQNLMQRRIRTVTFICEA